MLTSSDIHPFIERIQKMQNEHYAVAHDGRLDPPQMLFTMGPRWAKIIRKDSFTHAYAFIAVDDFSTKMLGDVKKGDVFMAATWKAPAKHARGSIYDDSIDFCGPYGVCYMK